MDLPWRYAKNGGYLITVSESDRMAELWRKCQYGYWKDVDEKILNG